MRPSDARLLKAFGRTVRSIRARRGMAQESLAEAAELSRNYISDIERGVRNPGLIALVRLARALRVDVAQLIGDADKA